jgi:hypothetical protein
MIIGSATPRVVLYLNTDVPELGAALSDVPKTQLCQSILAHNNNNWRKILTIFAKLTAPNDDWREYLQQQLLLEQQINLGTQLVKNTQWHLIAGKKNWPRFEPNLINAFSQETKKHFFTVANRIYAPYPDYRQFPNALVEKCRQHLLSNIKTIVS